ncbi:hypothetical protein GM182_02070 [bacterium 3DAC]|nr:hypothetical protein GM182_02070 [bacterium 3DAC]
MARLFNVHTTWGEGTYTPQQWIDYARKHNIDEIVFIDFVPPSKWEEYKEDMEKLDFTGVKVSYGVEVPAKVLKDTPSSLLEIFDIIAVSERCFGKDDDVPRIMEDLLLQWTKKLPLIYWIRPGMWYKEYGDTLLGLEYYVEILKRVPENKIILEVNRRYNVPPPYIPALLDELGYRFVVGVDAGSPEELPQYEIPILGFTFADAEE